MKMLALSGPAQLMHWLFSEATCVASAIATRFHFRLLVTLLCLLLLVLAHLGFTSMPQGDGRIAVRMTSCRVCMCVCMCVCCEQTPWRPIPYIRALVSHPCMSYAALASNSARPERASARPSRGTSGMSHARVLTPNQRTEGYETRSGTS